MDTYSVNTHVLISNIINQLTIVIAKRAQNSQRRGKKERERKKEQKEKKEKKYLSAGLNPRMLVNPFMVGFFLVNFGTITKMNCIVSNIY